MRKQAPLALLISLTFLYICYAASHAYAAGELRLKLTVEAIPALKVEFFAEGKQPAVELPAVLDDAGHETGRYALQFTTEARGGVLVLTQHGAMVSRDAISWTYPPGTVADLAATYQVDSLRRIVLVDFRRTGVNLRAEDDIAPDETPLSHPPLLTPTTVITTTATISGTTGAGGGGSSTGTGLLFAAIGLGLGVVFWLMRRSKPAPPAQVAEGAVS